MMDTYLVDTNVILRYLLGDSPQQQQLAAKFFKKAKLVQVKLKVIMEVVPELEFEQRQLWIETFNLYLKVKADPVDIFMFVKSRSQQAKVLTFDQDFKKFKSLGI